MRRHGEKRNRGSLRGLRVLVTAGPTREHLDPVRFLSNPSTGKMGYALAQACLERGALVTLVSGPVALTPPKKIRFIGVESARQMFQAARAAFAACDIFIAAAAVSDFRPAEYSASKIKKDAPGSKLLKLKSNPDILQSLSRAKGRRLLVGFAAETGNLLANARVKLGAKRLDLMVANRVGGAGEGFASDFNRVTMLWPSGRAKSLGRKSKQSCARAIVKEIEKLIR